MTWERVDRQRRRGGLPGLPRRQPGRRGRRHGHDLGRRRAGRRHDATATGSRRTTLPATRATAATRCRDHPGHDRAGCPTRPEGGLRDLQRRADLERLQRQRRRDQLRRLPRRPAADHARRPATSWTDSAPVGNTVHRYRVLARDAAGNESALSNEVVRTVDSTAPSSPANLRAVSRPPSVALTWNASTDNVGVTSYVVYRDGLPLMTLGGTTTAWTDSAPVGNTLHRYRVTARDAAGNESGPSNEVARTIDTVAPTVPATLVAVSSPTERRADLGRVDRRRRGDQLRRLPRRAAARHPRRARRRPTPTVPWSAAPCTATRSPPVTRPATRARRATR